MSPLRTSTRIKKRASEAADSVSQRSKASKASPPNRSPTPIDDEMHNTELADVSNKDRGSSPEAVQQAQKTPATKNISIRDAVSYMAPPSPPAAQDLNASDAAVPPGFPAFLPIPIFNPLLIGQSTEGFMPSPMMPLIQPGFNHLIQHSAPQYSVNDGNSAMDALADLSASVGAKFVPNDLKSVRDAMLRHQFTSAQKNMSNINQFFSTISRDPDEITFGDIKSRDLNKMVESSKELYEIFLNWKDSVIDIGIGLIEDEMAAKYPPDAIVIGLRDPNVKLALQAYCPPSTFKPTVEDLAFTADIERMNAEYRYTAVPYGVCDQCGTDETIQWRRGPNGEKTLCNACGLLYTKVYKKIGLSLATQLMAQRKFTGCYNHRKVPVTLLGEEPVPYYEVEEVDTGKKVEILYSELSNLSFFDGKCTPPQALKPVIMRPLLYKLMEKKIDVSHMNAKYDPSHEVSPIPKSTDTKTQTGDARQDYRKYTLNF